MTTYEAILPAGGTIDAGFAGRVGTTNKALIEFEGTTILQRTLDALGASGRIGKTVVIGTDDVLASDSVNEATHKLKAGGSGPDNILKGLKFLLEQPNPPDKVLIATTDMPFLSGKIIQDFLDRCSSDCDIHVPLVSKTSYTTRFPNSTATFVPLRDNLWTIGGAYVIDSQAFQVALPHIQKLFVQRKSKLGMVKLLGPRFLFKYLTKTLTLPDVEGKIRAMLGCSGSAVMDAPPELAYDIDDLEDYEYALKHLGGNT